MRAREIASGAVAVAVALAGVPLAGQGQSDATRRIAAKLAAPVKGFVQPKTEWAAV